MLLEGKSFPLKYPCAMFFTVDNERKMKVFPENLKQQTRIIAVFPLEMVVVCEIELLCLGFENP